MISKAPIPKYSIIQKFKLFKLGIKNWDIPTYTTANELFKLFELAKGLESNSIGVEIGSYIGASSLLIGKGMPENAKLYCIDTWENDAMTEGNWDTYGVFEKNTNKVNNKIIPIKSNSVYAAKDFKNQIDFLFIDGDHTYEGVKADVDAWFGKLKSGGIIIMHDFEWAEGVIKVVEENVKTELKKFDHLPNMFWGWKK